MNKNLTDITLVVDRSGSMTTSKQSAEDGVNEFVRKQAMEEGEALVTIHQFDDQHDTFCKAVPAEDAPKYTLEPRGMTALYDAVGMAINDTNRRLKRMKKKDRPGLVVIAIVTDGAENSSKEFSGDKIKNMIKHFENEHDWKFTFIGAGVEAYTGGLRMGFNRDTTLHGDSISYGGTYMALSTNVSRMRNDTIMGRATKSAYTEEERDQAISNGE